MKKQLEFFVTIPTLIVISVLCVTYLVAYILQLNGLSFLSLLSCYFIQSISLGMFTFFYFRKFFNDYYNKTESTKLGFFLNSLIFSLLVIFFLFLFDYFFSYLIDFYLSNNYGEFLDNLLESPNSNKIESESFKILPLTLQNIILNILCFPIIVYISCKYFKTK